ncbi:MAG: type II/IV secretion system ATPase subunit [Clostridia bacterium]
MYKKFPKTPHYIQLLEKVQFAVNENYWQLNAEKTNSETKQLIMAFYRQYLTSNNISLDGYTIEELAEKLYNDTHEYSILTAPLNDPNVEGIHVNAWDCVILQFRDNSFLHIEAFENPSHAVDIMRRLIQEKGKVLDESMPIAETSIGSDIRITTAKSPIVDENIGVSCYIRKLSKTVFSIEKYTSSGFGTIEEIDMISTFMKHGVSVLVVGKVNTGKTTFLSYLLSTLSNNTKIVTIENSAREMNLVKVLDGEVVNNVVHFLTRESKEAMYNISQEDLLSISLRYNPDYISVAEMRDKEASVAVEASRSGHPVISTTHAGSPREAHKRIADLARKGNSTDYATALLQAQEAFSVVVFLHALNDNTRRIMGVTECFVDEENKAHYNPLWKYEIEENDIDGDFVKVVGEHKKLGVPSDYLIEKMKMYGISQKDIKILGGKN